MRVAKDWTEYQLLDTSSGDKFESWNGKMLVRPDPQVIWKTSHRIDWNQADAVYHRSNEGGGYWEYRSNLPESWYMNYKDLTFKIKPTGFKHTGLFPEQAVNWDYMANKIRNSTRPVNVLNMFAYTGGATLSCAKVGANVCHVDASKGMVNWAKENAYLSHLQDKPIRWIIDDCEKFVIREIRRERQYDAIIMDPPSYGRGKNGEIWKLEDGIYDLIELCTGVLSKNPLFFIVNSYTTGLSPSVIAYIMQEVIVSRYGGRVSYDEIGLPIKNTNLILPCGSTAIWERF